MLKQIERKIILFTEATGVAERAEFVHGTLFVKFHNSEDKEWFRISLKNFCKDFINDDTGINGNVVGDEFAYDIVPAKDETTGWNTSQTQESLVDTYINQQEGK